MTGGARRIGREIALTLARSGADVAFTYLHSENEARSTAAEIAALGVRALHLQCDMRNVDAIRSIVQQTVAALGRIDLLVNNAGLYLTKEFEQISSDEWDSIFAVNVRGAFLMTQACAPQLRRNHGRVINLGSLGGMHPWPSHVHYCASKAALHMLTQASAKALAGVTVNCVAPGMIDQHEANREELLERFARKTPMQKNGTAADVAQAVLFFATCPDFITGQILSVDGGLGLS